MTRNLIYIGDDLLHISAKSLLAVTYQLVDIRDLIDRKISFSSNVELPPTENNLALLGSPNNVKSESSIPYEQIQARCVSNGLEYFKGRLEIAQAQGRIKANIKQNIIDIFEQIRGLKLVDLDFLSDSAWLAADIDTARTASSGVVSPVINWGQFQSTPAINSTLYLPSYFYRETVQAILDSTGFTFAGDALMSNSDLDDLIMPFSRGSFEYDQKFEDDRTFNATFNGNQQITTSTTEQIDLDSAEQNGLYFNVATSQYEIPSFTGTLEIGKLNLFLDITMDVNITSGTGVDLEIRIIGTTDGTLVTSGVFSITSDQVVKRSISILDTPAYSGDDYYAEIVVTFQPASTAIITINPVFFYGNFTKEINRNWVFHKYLLPDIDQTELLTDFFVRIGAFFTLDTDGVTVNVNTINDVINAKYLARDWTDKRVKRDDRIIFSYESYTQSNYFKYTQGDGVSETMGRGNLPVGNQNLDSDSVFFESPFENCQTLNPEDVAINMAYIPVYDGTSVNIEDFVNDPGIKLLTLRPRGTNEPSVTFNATPRADYQVGYFVDVSEDKDTGFQYFIDQYYSGLVAAFDKTKLIDRDYVLTEEDITTDLFIIYDSGNYFLVNKIPKFIPGQVTEAVELLRIF